MPPAPLARSGTATVMLATAVLLWSGNFVARRALGDDIGSIALNVWRWTLAFVVLVPLAWSEVVRWRHLVLSAWRYLAILGLTGVTAFHVFVYKALEHSQAANAVLMLSTAPAVIVLIARLLLGERITNRQWLGIAVSFTGALVLIARGNLAALAALEPGPGDLWMLAAVPTWALYSVLLRLRPPELPGMALLTASTAFGLLWMAPLVAIWPDSITAVRWSAPVIGGIAYVGLGASVVAYLCWNRGVALVGPSRAGSYLHLMPLFAPLLAFVILDEPLHGYHAAGAVLVFAGIALTQGWGRRLPTRRINPARRS